MSSKLRRQVSRRDEKAGFEERFLFGTRKLAMTVRRVQKAYPRKVYRQAGLTLVTHAHHGRARLKAK